MPLPPDAMFKPPPPPKKKKKLEVDIETPVVKYARSKGLTVYKFKSPGQRSVMDRIFFGHKRLVFLIEFKRPKGVPTEKQEEKIKELRNKGHAVYVCDDVDEGKAIVDKELRR